MRGSLEAHYQTTPKSQAKPSEHRSTLRAQRVGVQPHPHTLNKVVNLHSIPVRTRNEIDLISVFTQR